MVLDTINENDELIFKNTHRNNKKVTIQANDPTAPDEFYFIHIEPLNNQMRRTSSSSSESSLAESNDEQRSSSDSEEPFGKKWQKRQKLDDEYYFLGR